MDDQDTRQERREEKQLKRRESMLKHGRGLARVYRDAILKRAKKVRRKRPN